MKCLQSNDERVRGADHQERGEVQGEEDGLHQPLVPLYHCGHQPATGKLFRDKLHQPLVPLYYIGEIEPIQYLLIWRLASH